RDEHGFPKSRLARHGPVARAIHYIDAVALRGDPRRPRHRPRTRFAARSKVSRAIDADRPLRLAASPQSGHSQARQPPGAMPRVAEMPSPEAFQHLPRFKNSFSRLPDLSLYALDASAHVGNLHEAMV